MTTPYDHTVSIVVTFHDETEHHFMIDPDSDTPAHGQWTVVRLRGIEFLVIGHGLPRVQIPLSAVRSIALSEAPPSRPRHAVDDQPTFFPTPAASRADDEIVVEWPPENVSTLDLPPLTPWEPNTLDDDFDHANPTRSILMQAAGQIACSWSKLQSAGTLLPRRVGWVVDSLDQFIRDHPETFAARYAQATLETTDADVAPRSSGWDWQHNRERNPQWVEDAERIAAAYHQFLAEMADIAGGGDGEPSVERGGLEYGEDSVPLEPLEPPDAIIKARSLTVGPLFDDAADRAAMSEVIARRNAEADEQAAPSFD